MIVSLLGRLKSLEGNHFYEFSTQSFRPGLSSLKCSATRGISVRVRRRRVAQGSLGTPAFGRALGYHSLIINAKAPGNRGFFVGERLIFLKNIHHFFPRRMKLMNAKNSRVYLISMAVYWFVFGLITTFYPKLMDLFQTAAGVNAKTPFSDHVWSHDGFDIIALVVVLFALSREAVISSRMLKAAAVAALLPTLAIGFSFFTTPYWSPLFLVPWFGCLAFAVWGFVLAGKAKGRVE